MKNIYMKNIYMLFCIFLCSLFFGCSESSQEPYPKLSQYKFFVDMKQQIPSKNVIPYDLNTPLFSDYSHKRRFVFVPQGKTIQYREQETFLFPVGSALIKTFSMLNDINNPQRGEILLETRILIKNEDGWKAYPYIWNKEQTDATLELVGDIIDISWIHLDGNKRTNSYVVPNVNDCKSCHSKNNQFVPIGPQAKHLNKDFLYGHEKDNQISYWQKVGILKKINENVDKIPKVVIWDDSNSPINERARAYLDINCAHCHSPDGPANNAGLDFRYEHNIPENLGVFKAPVAAGHGTGGRDYDIVPGKPEESILLYRMNSIAPGVAMPEFGRGMIHEEAVNLIRDWIQQMKDKR